MIISYHLIYFYNNSACDAQLCNTHFQIFKTDIYRIIHNRLQDDFVYDDELERAKKKFNFKITLSANNQ